MSKPKNKKSGFTLIELLVSLGIFSIAVVLTAGSYLVIISLNQRAQTIATLANDTAFVLENMTRLIRTGTEYSCGASLGAGDCSSGGTTFTFKDPSTPAIVTTYTRVPAAGAVKGFVRITAGGTQTQLTNPAVDITGLTFYLTGSAVGDTQQPYVRMVIKGTANAGHGQTFDFTIETAAAMRGIDI